jgi:starvation-inducible DNA-binding protein
MKTNIGISEKNTQVVAEQLSILLADEFVLYTKTLNAHWNLVGPDFHAMHLYFEELYKESTEIIDSVAERIRQIGHYAPAKLKTLLKLTHLTEEADGGNTSLVYIKSLLEDHQSIIEFIRGNIESFEEEHKDVGTSDFVTGLMKKHEKIAWMLRAHLVK